MEPYLVTECLFFWMTGLDISVVVFHAVFCCVAHFILLFKSISSHHFMLNLYSLQTIDE